MKAVVIGDRETVTLFAIEGFEGIQVDSESEAMDAVRQVRRARTYGLLIVTEQVSEWAHEPLGVLRFSRELPIVIDIPDARGHRKTRHSLEDFIREAVGIRV